MPATPPKEGLRLYLRILAYLRPYTRSLVLIFIFNILFVIFNALSVWMVAPFINTLFKGATRAASGHTTHRGRISLDPGRPIRARPVRRPIVADGRRRPGSSTSFVSTTG